MPSFKDSHGREWQVSLDGITLKELRDAHKIDLSDVVGSVYSQLKGDPASLTVALSHICADQIRAADLTPKKFAAAVNGVVLDDAFKALWRAAELFFPPSLWSVLSTRFSQEEQLRDARVQMKPMLEMLSQPEVPSELREQAWVAIAKMLPSDLSSLTDLPGAIGLAGTPSNAATNSPDSAESTRAA